MEALKSLITVISFQVCRKYVSMSGLPTGITLCTTGLIYRLQ